MSESALDMATDHNVEAMTGIIDEDTVACLRSYGHEPGKILGELVESFLVEAPALLSQIEQATQGCAYEAAASSAHMLKGLSGLIGAGRLAAACGDVECGGRHTGPDRTKDPIEVLRAETGLALIAMRELLEDLQRSWRA
jgi:HPt (histidine-containing phosphotransfer) domain-containing protein